METKCKQCPRCSSTKVNRNGFNRNQVQRLVCKVCGKHFQACFRPGSFALHEIQQFFGKKERLGGRQVEDVQAVGGTPADEVGVQDLVVGEGVRGLRVHRDAGGVYGNPVGF